MTSLYHDEVSEVNAEVELSDQSQPLLLRPPSKPRRKPAVRG